MEMRGMRNQLNHSFPRNAIQIDMDDENSSPPTPEKPKRGVMKYGKIFPPGTNILTVELYAFKHNLTEEQGGLGKFQHFRNVVDLLWNRPNSPRRFIWSPWAEDMIREACDNMYLSVAGAASAGKSDSYALWGIVNYLCSPHDTLVILTSTTLREARRRVWKSVVEFWTAVPGLPGKLVDSLGQIKGVSKAGELTEASGLLLVPSEKKSEREAVGKLIGMKNERVILIADELPELPESIVHAAYGNMTANPYFQMIGLGNPASRFDAFGVFSKPKNGWGSVTEADYEWETARGKLIRFDAERSPNVLADEVIYPWMLTREKVEKLKETYGDKSLTYYRMIKAFWAPQGASDGVYSEADLIAASAPADFAKDPILVAGLDPSFTAGGDRTIAYFGKVGPDASGKILLEFTEFELLNEDVTDKITPRTTQIATKFIEMCKKRNVSSRNVGIDATGAGAPFCDVVASLWGMDDFIRVKFGGSASDLPVSASDRTPSKERYANRMSEIWYSGQELLRSKQLRGVCDQLAREMTARTYSTSKAGNGMRIRVESKIDFKNRTGASPDLADAAFVLLDVCRQRHYLIGNERFDVNTNRQQKWGSLMKKLDIFSKSERFLVQDS